MKSSQSVHKIVCWRLSGLHKIVTWQKTRHKLVNQQSHDHPGIFIKWSHSARISHIIVIWRLTTCHRLVTGPSFDDLRFVIQSSYGRETSKKVVIWRFSGCFRDDIKVVFRRLNQMTSFGRLWGVRFWYQFDNPKVVHLTTLFFERIRSYWTAQTRCSNKLILPLA